MPSNPTALETLTPEAVLDAWTGAGERAWFKADPAFDAWLADPFAAACEAAAEGAFETWRESPTGAMALVLLLDQFPRNIWRGRAKAFAGDPRARSVAEAAIARGFDLALPLALQPFLYLPFEHAEDAAAQARSLALFAAHAQRSGREDYLRFARIHADVIARFGRFPHRNAILGRETTPDEAAFLAAGGFRG